MYLEMDNYSSNKGDFQTIKQLYNNYTFKHQPGFLSLVKTGLIFNNLILIKIFQNGYSIKNDLDYNLGFLKSIQAKLNNKKFMENAPKNVLENELNKEKDTLAKISILKSKLNN